MPLSVQVLAPVSSSSPSASSTNSGGERAFSRHLETERRGETPSAHSASRQQDKAPSKPVVEESTAERRASADEPEKALVSTSEKHNTEGDGAAGGRDNGADSLVPQGESSADEGSQNTALSDSPEHAQATPLVTMGERVRLLLAAEANLNGEKNSANEALTDPLAISSSGNTPPPEDALLPPQTGEGEAVEAEVAVQLPVDVDALALLDSQGEASVPGGVTLLPVDVDALALLDSQEEVATSDVTGVSAAAVAAALRESETLDGDDLAALSSTPRRSLATSDVLARLNPALASVLPGKPLSVPGGLVDDEPDIESALDLTAGKAIKPLLDGATASVNLKAPGAQATPDLVFNGLNPKESFQQVRQNIMAAMAGQSEITGPALALKGGAEGAESVTAGLNTTSVSSTLALPSAESAKYSATQESAAPRYFTLQTPVGQPGWDAEVGNRIRWMVGQNNSGLELRLNPPELGSIEVKLATEGERTSVTFFAANPAARDALEAALPRLREMFAESGMELANADVAERDLPQERESLSDSESFASGGDTGEAILLEGEPGFAPGAQAEGRGVIDYYI